MTIEEQAEEYRKETHRWKEALQKSEAKVEQLEQELGKKEYEITQLQGTIADLHEQILAYHS